MEYSFHFQNYDLLGDRKVDEFDFPVAAEQKIVGLDVAMDIAFGVQVIERLAGLIDDRGQLVSDRFWSTAKRHFEIQFAKELHDDKRSLGIGAVFDQLDNVLVVEILGHFKLMLQKSDFLFVASLIRT